MTQTALIRLAPGLFQTTIPKVHKASTDSILKRNSVVLTKCMLRRDNGFDHNLMVESINQVGEGLITLHY